MKLLCRLGFHLRGFTGSELHGHSNILGRTTWREWECDRPRCSARGWWA